MDAAFGRQRCAATQSAAEATAMRKLLLIVIVSFVTPFVNAQETKHSQREARRSRYMDAASKVTGGSLTPHLQG